MIDTTQIGNDFGAVIDDWPEELLIKGDKAVRCLIDELSFSKKVVEGGIVSDYGGAVYIKVDELGGLVLEAKDQVEVRSKAYKVLKVSLSPDQVHFRVDLQVLGR